MKKDELIDLYLLSKSFIVHDAYEKRMYIKLGEFDKAMQREFDMHFWQDELQDVCLELHKKGWYCDAVEEAWV
jgi:endonuclease III-like uncharacterized protein